MRAGALLLLGLFAACEPAPEPDDAAAQATVDTGPVLADEAYRFCHVPGADAADAREFCDLLRDLPPERCPGLRATCEEGAEESILDPAGCAGFGVGGAPGSKPAPPPEKPKEPFKLEPFSCETPENLRDWLSAILRWGGAIVVAIVLLVVVRLILAALGWARPERGPAVPEREVEVVTVSPDEVPDLPVADLLDAARRALGEGRWADVVLLARGASLRRLAEAGRVRLHRSRTDREYLRSVRRDAEVHEPLGEVMRAVEQHRWGGAAVGESIARSVLAAAERLLRVVGAVMLLLLVVGAGDDWRYGPQGDAALYDLLVRHGYTVSWRLRGLSELDEDTDVLVVDLSGITPSDEDWQAMRAWVEQGHLLWIAGDVETGFPEVGEPVPLPEGTEARLVRLGDWLPAPRWPQGPAQGWEDAQGDALAVTGEHESEANARLKSGEEPLPGPSTTVVQVLYFGQGTVLAVSDARLLWNGALVHPDNEVFVGEVVRTGDLLGYWWLSEPMRVQLATVAAAGSQSPVGSLANARLLPFVLQLLALVVLAALWRGWPFGPLRDPPGEGRLRFSDHVRALASRYARLGASRHVLASYAGLWLARLGPAGLEEAARQAGRSPDEARRLVAAAQEAAGDPEGARSPRDLDLMEELWKITKHG